MALYSASADDLETVGCFFDLQDISESPRNTEYPVTLLLVSKHLAQSLSVKAFKVRSDLEESKMPGAGVDFKYLSSPCAAARWPSVGLHMLC